MDTLPDYFRKLSISELFKMSSFAKSWTIWQPTIKDFLGENPSPSSLIDLGDHLAEVFITTNERGRSQSSLSGGGAAWEALITWYINFCTVGSRIVAVKKMSLVPKPIQNALTVNYGNFACNTESDITIIVFPDLSDYLVSLPSIEVKDTNNNKIEPFKRNKFDLTNIANNLARRDFETYEVGVVQCKTNWNDNAQIPMLWDMIYSANGFKDHKITIGKEGYSIQDLNNFSYSFVTVPSNKRTTYKSESVAVKRVTNLTGGNYWGKPTSQHVAKSIKEIFNSNFQSGFNNSLRQDLKKAIPYLDTKYDFFKV